MDAIYLLACYISRDESIRQYETNLLSRARQGLVSDNFTAYSACDYGWLS